MNFKIVQIWQIMYLKHCSLNVNIVKSTHSYTFTADTKVYPSSLNVIILICKLSTNLIGDQQKNNKTISFKKHPEWFELYNFLLKKTLVSIFCIFLVTVFPRSSFNKYFFAKCVILEMHMKCLYENCYFALFVSLDFTL